MNWHRWSSNISEFEFRRYYRMERETFRLLCQVLAKQVEGDALQGRRGSPHGVMSVELKVSMTLRWLAGGSYLDIYHFHGVSLASFWKAKQQVLDAINACEALDIIFPDLDDEQELAKIALGFRHKSEMYVFDHCVGALDGLLIDLHCIKGEASRMATRYFTRKSSFAINVQAVCDSRRRFRWIGIHNPGSVHDSIAFMHGSLWRALENADSIGSGYHLVADAAYKGVKHILVPFDGQGLPQWHDSYNFHLSQIRIQVECAFGLLTNRWGIFWRGLRVDDVGRASAIIEAAMRLHNFVIDHDTVVEPEEDVLDAEEQRSDMSVPDRLSESDRPERNANGAPARSLWYFPEAGVEEAASNIAMRAAIIQRLRENDCPRPAVDRFGRRSKRTAKVLGRQ
jgi:hypothetical protein